MGMPTDTAYKQLATRIDNNPQVVQPSVAATQSCRLLIEMWEKGQKNPLVRKLPIYKMCMEQFRMINTGAAMIMPDTPASKSLREGLGGGKDIPTALVAAKMLKSKTAEFQLDSIMRGFAAAPDTSAIAMPWARGPGATYFSNRHFLPATALAQDAANAGLGPGAPGGATAFSGGHFALNADQLANYNAGRALDYVAPGNA